MKDKIVLAGGTGFLGKALAQSFAEKEYEVVLLGGWRLRRKPRSWSP